MEKIIHYCWFGPKPLGKLEKKCIASWKKYLPDYKIMKWSEENVDLNECEFIKEAYAQKKWAFVADYVRTKVLYEYGGIYMDTDMEIISDLKDFEDKDLVFGLEDSGEPNAAIVIANKKHNTIKRIITITRNVIIPFLFLSCSIFSTPFNYNYNIIEFYVNFFMIYNNILSAIFCL